MTTYETGGARAGISVMVVFILAGLLISAGGLMVAPLVFLGGLFAFPISIFKDFRRDIPWEALVATLFIAWVCVTWFWSPYDKPDQMIKLALGIPFYAAFAVACARLRGRWKARAESLFLFATMGAALILLLESFTGSAMTTTVKAALEGGLDLEAMAPATLVDFQIRVSQSLGHGALPLILMAGPAAALAWREGGPLIGLTLIGIAIIVGFSFSISVNAVAVLFAMVIAAATYWRPRGMLSGLFGAMAGAFVVIPLILPGLATMLPQSIRNSIPASWDIRLDIWAFAGETLQERLWTGWGFDASRVISQDGMVRGQAYELLPLHPHNAPLHVWLETGLIGSMLLTFALVMIGGRVAGAPQLSRLQAAAIAWVVSAYFVFIFFSYGIWQEWHLGALGLALGGTMFLGAKGRAR